MIRKPKLATIGIDERQDHAKGPDAQRNGSDDFLVDDMSVVAEIILDKEIGQYACNYE